MKILILLFIVAFSALTMAAPTNEPIITVTGKLADMKGDFVKLQPKGATEPVWVHKSFIVGEIVSTKVLQALLTPSDIFKYQDELAKLQNASKK